MALQKWLLLVSVVWLTACGGGSSSSGGGDPEPPTIVQISDKITSGITGITYPLDVYLPIDYQEITSPLPVIYATDGQYSSWTYANEVEKYGVDVILVVVHEGPFERREIDFLPPGVDDYYLFLTQELISKIEAQYNIEPTQRTLVGHSFGGAMAAYMMLSEPIGAEFFKHYVISDGSFWRDPEVMYPLEEQRYQASSTLDVTAIFSGTHGYLGNYHYVSEFYNTLQARQYQSLVLPEVLYYGGISHEKMWHHTFRDSLPILFPKSDPMP